MKYILENIFTSNDCYIIQYNKDKYMQIKYNGYFIDLVRIHENKLTLLSPNTDLYVLFKFPFKIIRDNDGQIIFSFLPLLNSYIVFSGLKNKLFITVSTDNITSHMSYVFTNGGKKVDYIQIYIQNVKQDDISKLTYIDGAEIYNMGTAHNPYIYIYMPDTYIKKLIDLSKINKWKLQCNKTILF